MKIQKDVLLKNYTTFRIGGPAKYFCIAKTKKDLIEVIKWAKRKNLLFFVLGGGSNVLIADQGFNGLVIKYQDLKLAQLVEKGLEWAVGIPGTVAGAIKGNAGAFGKSMAQVVKTVQVFDVKDEKIKIFKNKDCQFGYRNSIFKKNPNLIILSAQINLEKSDPQKIKKYLEYRKETQPLNLPSAGSIFKNPEQSSGLSKFPYLSAGELIEKCNLKGKKIGRAQISKKHANFIVNLGGAKAEQVLKLINFAKQKVKEKFGINLEEEVEKIGSFPH